MFLSSSFLVTTKRLYKRLCPSVRRLVGWSVRPSATLSLYGLLRATYGLAYAQKTAKSNEIGPLKLRLAVSEQLVYFIKLALKYQETRPYTRHISLLEGPKAKA